MRATNQFTMRNISALFILSSGIAISTIFCAPNQQATVSSIPTSTTTAAKMASPSTTTLAPKLSLMTSASTSSAAAPSLVNLKNPIPPPERNLDTMDAFDGKNPFGDDSLWQIPIHLVRDLTANDYNQPQTSNDNMAKSASETSSSAETDSEDDDESNYGPQGLVASLPQSSSSSPTVISASTDLKTAAGYHYPSHGGHDAGHYGGHHGGHHGGDHYHGKYFQYASVPYPYAWEFGYRRGNPYHTIERYEHGKGPHFKTKVKWSDKSGYGVHVWDYNHDDHHSHHYGGHDHHDSHGSSHYGGGHHGGHYGHH